MRETSITVSDQPDPGFIEQIADGLNAYNDAIVGHADRLPLAVMARDAETGELVGGISGRSSLGLLFLDLVHIVEACRGAGLGRQLLEAAEAEGRRRGCVAAVLYTISFQAPGFYERHGWARFGEIPCLPPGTRRIFMSKSL